MVYLGAIITVLRLCQVWANELYYFDRQVLQTKRDHLTKESNEFKSDYGKYMASMSKKVTEGKLEHARLTSHVSSL